MNNKIIIKVTNNLNRFISKCIKYQINITDVEYLSDNTLTCKIDLNDYKRVKKLNYYSKINILKYTGLIGLEKRLKKNIYTYLVILFCFITIDILTSIIVRVDIIHENKKVRDLISKELINHNIKKYSLSLSYEELEKIKKDILKNNTDLIEWMSITRNGMTYIIRVEERIINKEEKESLPRNIIASKDALITKVVATKGEVLVRSGDYVRKGDTLISGKIYLNEEAKDLVSSTGTIYGKVWYNVDIKIPKVKEEIIYTGKKRYNLNINNKMLLKNKYHYFSEDNIKEIKILGFIIKIYREKEYLKNNKILSNELALEEAFNYINETFKNKLKENGTIINQKVLKKEENNSTIDYRIFVVTNEIISTYEYFKEGD